MVLVRLTVAPASSSTQSEVERFGVSPRETLEEVNFSAVGTPPGVS